MWGPWHVAPNVECERVSLTTLDEVVGSERVFLMKLDVEGHELSVLESGVRALRERRIEHILSEFTPAVYGATSDGGKRLLKLLANYGYDAFELPFEDAAMRNTAPFDISDLIPILNLDKFAQRVWDGRDKRRLRQCDLYFRAKP